MNKIDRAGETRKNKFKRYRIGGKIYNLYAYAHIKKNDIVPLYDTIFTDVDYKKLDLTKIVGSNYNQYTNNLQLDKFFVPIKKQFERDNPNTLIVFDYSLTYQKNNSHKGKATHMKISLSKFYPEAILNTKSIPSHADENIALINSAMKIIADKLELIE